MKIQEKSSFPEPQHPILMNGIVFYVYSGNQCKQVPSYMEEVEKNARAIHSFNSNVDF